MVFKGHVRQGVVVFDTTCELADGTVVRIEPISSDESLGSMSEAGDLFRVSEMAKPTGVSDLALNHDHYLYGHPKVEPL